MSHFDDWSYRLSSYGPSTKSGQKVVEFLQRIVIFSKFGPSYPYDFNTTKIKSSENFIQENVAFKNQSLFVIILSVSWKHNFSEKCECVGGNCSNWILLFFWKQYSETCFTTLEYLYFETLRWFCGVCGEKHAWVVDTRYCSGSDESRHLDCTSLWTISLTLS